MYYSGMPWIAGLCRAFFAANQTHDGCLRESLAFAEITLTHSMHVRGRSAARRGHARHPERNSSSRHSHAASAIDPDSRRFRIQGDKLLSIADVRLR